jgi:hypothetical protein
MELVFVKVPKTASTFFEKNFDLKYGNIGGNHKRVRSVGHSWLYPTQIKGWRDWDFPEQEWGMYRDVDTYFLKPTDRVVTIVRNPFALLFSYFNYDWAWCRSSHELPTKEYTKEDFQKFVDIYLDDTIPFHVPAFKKSLFSQLKDKDGKWILENDSIVIRFERLNEDIKLFSNLINVPITDYSNNAKNEAGKKPCNWWEAYREDQIHKLTELWNDDLEYFGYSYNDNPADIVITPNEIKKPKIAICFSGFIRDIEHTKEFWTSLIDKYNIDVYGSFWDDENSQIGDTISNLKKIYNFKELEFERYSNFKKSTLDVISPYLNASELLLQQLRDYAKNFHTLSMWYKVWKVNMLSKNLDIEYDIVLRARTDTYFDGNLEIVKNNLLNIPSGRVRADNFPNSDGICDVFAYATPSIMDYYSSIYLNMLEYVNQGHYMIPPENLLRVHMSRVDLSLRFFTNKLVITRNSKGTPNEIYDKRIGVDEEILPSNFIDSTPNEDIKWTVPIRENLKF